MGIFDSLGQLFAPNIQGAAQPYLNAAYQQTAPFLAQGRSDIAGGYGAAIPTVQQGTAQALPYQQSVFNTGQTGTDALLRLLGLGGAVGTQGALSALESTPGYEFTLGQGLEGINRAAAAGGQLGSGATQAAGAKYASGLADQTYQQMVQNFMPFLNTLQSGATGAANVIGQGATNVAGLQTGQGQALATQGNVQAQLPWTYGTQEAALAGQQATANANYGIGLIGGLGNLATGSNFFGAGVPGSSMFTPKPSDERLKRDVEKVGELYDGLGVFKYKYLWDDTPQIGVMAQDVEKKYPEAVVDIGGGYKGVHYDRATSHAAQLARFLEAA